MRTLLTAAIAATLTLAPLAAMAQDTGEGMQGPPNAAGMSKSGKHSMSAKPKSRKVKGPPNADGASGKS